MPEQPEDREIASDDHEDPAAPPAETAFTPERESDRSTAAYGEPDEIDSTELVADPDEREGDGG